MTETGDACPHTKDGNTLLVSTRRRCLPVSSKINTAKDNHNIPTGWYAVNSGNAPDSDDQKQKTDPPGTAGMELKRRRLHVAQ